MRGTLVYHLVQGGRLGRIFGYGSSIMRQRAWFEKGGREKGEAESKRERERKPKKTGEFGLMIGRIRY